MKKLLSSTALAVLLFVFFNSCSLINGNGGWGSVKAEKNQAEKSAGQKLTVSFSCQDISRASLAPDALSFSDITKIELTARKLIEEDGSSDFEDYIFDASSDGASSVKTWISGISETSSSDDTSVVGVDQGASANTSDGQATFKTAYQKMTSDSVEMDLGSYIFSIKLYTGGLSGDTGTSDFRLTLTGSLGSEESPYRLTKAEILTFETAYVETGKLSLTFEWKLSSIKSDRIGKIEAGLFTMASKGSSALVQDDQDFDFEELEILTLSSGSGSEDSGTSAGSGTSSEGTSGSAGDSGSQDSIITYNALYQKDEVPNGTYFLKYRLYDSRGNLVLNSLMSLVKIHGWKTENTIEIDAENINSLPEAAGYNFVVDDKRVYFDVEAEGKLYLNKGNINYRAYQINSKGEEVDLPSDTISAMLFYRGQDVSGSYFKTDSSESEGKIVLGQDSSGEYACLPKGGTYQVYIMIFDPTNSVLASDYFDIEVEDYEYYRYSLESQTSFIKDDATQLFPKNTAFYNLESDLKKLEHRAIIEIYGNPDASLEENEDYKGTIEHNGESLSYIKGFYMTLSSILHEDYVFDIYLDLSELGDKLCVIDSGDCFNYNSTLKNLILPKNLISIGDSSFSDLPSLEKVTIYDLGNNLEIGNQIFTSCKHLKEFQVIHSDDASVETKFSTTAEGKVLLQAVKNEESSELVGQKIILICSSLESLDLSDQELFPGAREVNNKNTLITQIGKYAVLGRPYSSDNSSNYNYTLKRIAFLDFVTSIEEYSFYHCSALETLDLSDCSADIGEYAFSGCESLSSLVLPDTITSIPDYAFNECESLKILELPETLTSVGNSAFSNCKGLEKLVLPESLTNIGNTAFSSCGLIKNITINVIPAGIDESSTEIFDSSAVENLEINCDITSENYEKARIFLSSLGSSYYDTYSANVTFNGDVTLADADRTGVNSWGNTSLLQGMTGNGLESLTFNKKAVIGQNQFAYAKVLKNIVFSDESNSSTIESKAFYREDDGDDDNGNEWYDSLDLTGLIYIAEDNFKPGVTELTLSDENNWYKLSATETNKNNVSAWLSEKPETITTAAGDNLIEKITETTTEVEGVPVTKTVKDNIKDIFASTDTTNKYMLYHLIAD